MHAAALSSACRRRPARACPTAFWPHSAGSAGSGRYYADDRPSSFRLRRNGIGAASGSPIIVDLAGAQPRFRACCAVGIIKMRCGSPAPALIDSTSCGPSVPSAEVDIRKSCHSRRHRPATIRGTQIDRPGLCPTRVSRRHHPPAIRAAHAPVRVSQMHRADMRQTVRPLAFQTSAAACFSDVSAAHPTARQADP